MKKLVAILIATVLATSAYANTKSNVTNKPVPTKKIAKKHQKFDGSKIADDKPTKPKAPAKKK